nr:alpha/beta fold hydrolase [Diaphorobacter aerolatus]
MSDLPALDGLRLHYLDEGPRDARRTWLLIHGHPTWSYVFRDLIPVFLAAGDRVIAPDLIGFGKSDKPKKEAAHRLAWHAQVLQQLVERLDARNVVLVNHGLTGLLGLAVPTVSANRYAGMLALNTWLTAPAAPLPMNLQKWHEQFARKPKLSIAGQVSPAQTQETPAWDAPFPDAGYRAAVRAFAGFIADAGEPDFAKAVLAFWRDAWRHKSLLIAGGADVLVNQAAMQRLGQRIANAPEPRVIDAMDHFISSHGDDVAHRAVEYFRPS